MAAFGRQFAFGLDRGGLVEDSRPDRPAAQRRTQPSDRRCFTSATTDRDKVYSAGQITTGALSKSAVGTALLGPSPDGTGKAMFAVVTADGAIVQEHTLKGLDGPAQPDTVRPILGSDRNAQDEPIEPRFGVIMNPYAQAPVARQLFVNEPYYNSIAVIDPIVVGNSPDQVFGFVSVSRIGSAAPNLLVDMTPGHREMDNVK